MTAFPSYPAKATRPAVRNNETVDETTRNRLIETYLPLVEKVVAVVGRRLPDHVDHDDLHSAGVVGLIAAVQRFEAAQSLTFEGYARVRIRGAVLDELRRNDTCTRRSRRMIKRIEMVALEIAQAHGRPATDQEICARLEINESDLSRYRQANESARIISLDANEGDNPESRALHESIPDAGQESVIDCLQREELQQLLTRRLAELPSTEKRVLALYYFEKMKFVEIAEVLGLTESRISQIHRKAVTSLKRFLHKAQFN